MDSKKQKGCLMKVCLHSYSSTAYQPAKLIVSTRINVFHTIIRSKRSEYRSVLRSHRIRRAGIALHHTYNHSTIQ